LPIPPFLSKFTAITPAYAKKMREWYEKNLLLRLPCLYQSANNKFLCIIGTNNNATVGVYVQPGVFPGIEGTYTYNELRQQYQQYVQNSNYYRNQAPSDPYSTRQAMQQATGLYLNMNVNGAQASYGQAAHYNKRNEPWYTDHSRT
jgi:hypothetical protein